MALLMFVAFTTLALSPRAILQQSAAPAPQAGFATMNVCERVPGNELASAIAGRLLDARPINLMDLAAARCVYGVEIGGARRSFVLWLNPATDFAELRKAADQPVKSQTGIGDAAYATFAEDTKRYSLTATKRDRVTVQVTGERMEWVQAIARLALSKF